jgi:membrane associated rhomboid family serine protease
MRDSLDNPPKPNPVPVFGRDEKIFFIKVALILFGVYLFYDQVYKYWQYIAIILPVLFIFYVWYMMIQTGDRMIDVLKQYFTIIPIPRVEGGEKLFIPKATIFLILLNIFVFYFMKALPDAAKEFILEHLSFLPDVHAWWNILPSPFTSMFIHSNAGHLWGNMGFLWAFAPGIEERIGRKKFIMLYLLTGILGKFTAVIVRDLFLSEMHSSNGASGAISGIMGIFMVRCYFKKLIITLPLLGLVSGKVRINSLLPLGLYFLWDVEGGVRFLSGSQTRVAYWVHIGSLVAGVVLAILMKMHRDAAEEKYTSDGLAGLEGQVYGIDGVGQLQKALALNPDNEAALLAMARVKARRRLLPGRDLYEKSVALALRSDPDKAAKIYDEYFRVFNRMLSPDLEYRVAGILFSNGERKKAIRSLEMVVDEPSTSDGTRIKAFHQLIAILSEIGWHDKAKIRQRQFVEYFPKKISEKH